MRNIKDVAKDLAIAHRQRDPHTTVIKLVPVAPADEIHLLEVSSDAPSTGEVLSVRFNADPESGVDYPSVVVLLSLEEWPAVEAGQLSLPPGWDLSAAEDL